MSFAVTRDNVRLHYEEVGSGTPLLFVHEFAGDWRAWEPQMRYFARRYRCITYSARGYTPSDVPPSPDSYGYEKFRDDIVAMLDHLKIEKAHIVGLSMGGYATLCAGIKYPQRALSLTLAGTGSGSERWLTDALFAPEAREKYSELVHRGWTDAIRDLHPDERIYTFWHYWRNSFERDAGIRIDHLLLSPSLAPRLKRAGVDRTPRGWEKSSDHAPVWIELEV